MSPEVGVGSSVRFEHARVALHRSAPPLALLLMLLSTTAWAAASQGIRLYERGSYAKAVPALKQDIDSPKSSEQERALARVYLAASLLAIHKDAEAQQQLEELARTYPAQRVDAALFPPELVEMDKAVRIDLETARLRQETQRAERERLAAEAAAAAERARAAPPTAQREPRAVERREPQASLTPRVEDSESTRGASLRLRPEAVGYTDVWSRSVGYGVGLSLGLGALDSSLHVLPGGERRLGVSVEVGYLWGQGLIQPRVALRGTGVLKAGVGGGGVVGLRLTPLRRLTFLVDVGFERFLVAKELYSQSVLTLSAGVGFNLL